MKHQFPFKNGSIIEFDDTNADDVKAMKAFIANNTIEYESIIRTVGIIVPTKERFDKWVKTFGIRGERYELSKVIYWDCHEVKDFDYGIIFEAANLRIIEQN